MAISHGGHRLVLHHITCRCNRAAARHMSQSIRWYNAPHEIARCTRCSRWIGGLDFSVQRQTALVMSMVVAPCAGTCLNQRAATSVLQRAKGTARRCWRAYLSAFGAKGRDSARARSRNVILGWGEVGEAPTKTATNHQTVASTEDRRFDT